MPLHVVLHLIAAFVSMLLLPAIVGGVGGIFLFMLGLFLLVLAGYESTIYFED